MSMMCPPQRVKIVSTPSALSAFATKWPPDIVSGVWAGPASELFVAPATAPPVAVCAIAGHLLAARAWRPGAESSSPPHLSTVDCIPYVLAIIVALLWGDVQ